MKLKDCVTLLDRLRLIGAIQDYLIEIYQEDSDKHVSIDCSLNNLVDYYEKSNLYNDDSIMVENISKYCTCMDGDTKYVLSIKISKSLF